MRKQYFGRQFKRDANERKALFKGLMNDLVLKESIQTTEQKAKAIKGQVEKLVTKAKVRGAEARMFLQPYLSPKAVEKVLGDLAPRFAQRPGGYTRIVKLGARFSDNASMAVIEWVEKAKEEGKEVVKKVEKKVEKVEASVKTAKEAKPKAEKKPAAKKVTKAKKETK